MEEREKKIDDYINGKLNEKERQLFEQEMEKDQALKSEVELLQDIVGGIRLKANKTLKGRLDEIHDLVMENPKEAVVRPIRWKLIAGAAAAILLVLAVWFLLPQNSHSPERLYADHFEVFVPDWDSRGTEDISKTEQVKQLYESKQYDQLIYLLAQEDFSNALEPVKLNMIQGIASMETGRFEAAQRHFAEAAGNPLYASQAQWYLALCYLKMEDLDACRNTLERIITGGSPDYQQEARELLEEL